MLGVGNDVRIGFLYPIDLVNLCDHHIREGSFICDADEHNNVGAPKAGVRLFDAWEAFEGLQHIFCPSGFDLDQDIGFRCHWVLPVAVIVFRPASPVVVVQTLGGCSVPVALRPYELLQRVSSMNRSLPGSR